MGNALYELALHQNIQDKLRYEIKELMKKDGKFTYDNIKEMKYLDKVFKGEWKGIYFTYVSQKKDARYEV